MNKQEEYNPKDDCNRLEKLALNIMEAEQEIKQKAKRLVDEKYKILFNELEMYPNESAMCFGERIWKLAEKLTRIDITNTIEVLEAANEYFIAPSSHIDSMILKQNQIKQAIQNS